MFMLEQQSLEISIFVAIPKTTVTIIQNIVDLRSYLTPF